MSEENQTHPAAANTQPTPPANHALPGWLARNYLWLFLLTTFAGFAAGQLYRHLFALLAILGVVFLVRHAKSLWQDQRLKILLLLFACVWLPMVIATIDAEYFSRALRTTLRFSAYFFAGVAAIRLASKQKFSDRLLMGSFAVMLFMSLDGLVQWAFGSNFFGYPAFIDSRIIGVFHPRPYLALYLAIFSPIFFEAVRRLASSYRWAWVLLIPFFMVLILGASRTAWMLALFALVCYGIYFLRIQSTVSWRKLLSKVLLVGLLSTAMLYQSDYLEKRLVVIADLFSGDYTLATKATSERLHLWLAAVDMVKDKWINGIGPRGYQYTYQAYLPEDITDTARATTGPPHLLLLEVAAEAGLIGVIGLLVFLVVLISRLWTLSSRGISDAVPWGLCALTAAFPLSAAMPLYGYFYAQLLWFPLVIFVALLPVVETDVASVMQTKPPAAG